MDDLSGLDWSKPAPAQPKPAPVRPQTNQPIPLLRPTPSSLTSGRATPVSSSAVKTTTTTQDIFSNLVSFGQAKASQNLTLAERQAQLEAEKRKREDERKKQSEAQFGSGQQWDALGSRAFTPSPSLGAPTKAADDDDLFAAFNKDTKVDNASHYPPPGSERSASSDGRQLDLRDPKAWNPTAGSSAATLAVEDDDPFGLSEVKFSAAAPSNAVEDDDFLGDLGRPVDEVRKKRQDAAQPEPGKPIERDDSSSSEEGEVEGRWRRPSPPGISKGGDNALDRAVAQLVDYGFSPEDAMRGLTQSGSGTDPQAAVHWLLDEADRKAKKSWQGRNSSAGPIRTRMDEADVGMTGPMGEADFGRSAAAMGSSLFKTANSLWKTGQKRMQRAVADFQQEGDTGRPKWMREEQMQQRPSKGASTATDEALALESGEKPGPVHPDRRPVPQQSAPSSGSQSRSSPAPRWQQQTQPPAVSDARSRLNRLAATDDDDDSFSSHVRASRRKKPPCPSEPVKPDTRPDRVLDTEGGPKLSRPMAHRPAEALARNAAPSPPIARQPARRVPPMDPAALQASTRHRLLGTSQFKRGDFATAHSSYSSSMAGVPATHPLMIVLLTNRALTALKTGEPKQAVNDADEALKLIGPGRGRDEVVSVRGEDGQEEKKAMMELYGKALSRKAEALEQMEKWSDAGSVWQLCVEAGVGGATAVKGRQRCQDALKPKATKPKIAPAPKARPSATASLAPAKSSAAVVRLRQANEAAAREEDEKFALAEQVDGRVSAWRDGKRDNLRALLGSLDKVLWANSGWKSVGMHELVMTNRVKMVYMKAIAKTHPDKGHDTDVKDLAAAGCEYRGEARGWLGV
ncbi:hypothetical protein XA68_10336 [Ophiocordyceps unilateralis]|uniref:UBA domain-containing protein n=1 Tax=Ophiocordyceps unilateralis TaxID=268505 RepID=A0A2A9P2Y3_OPHUN|nr:hypothetical protein XA68_10336 [Ophiocordyceps unilateralis]